MDLMHAIQFETRQRLLSEQYPEMWDPLIRANATLDRITQDRAREKSEIDNVKGWKSHHDDHLEPVFTNIALAHLVQTKPNNKIINLLNQGISKKWNYLPDYEFEVDGLLFDETDNILYVIESIFHLTPIELSKALVTWEKLKKFLSSEKKKDARSFNRVWNYFFYEEDGLIQNRHDTIVKSFLGFHDVDSESTLNDAAKKKFQLIGPDGKHYKVFELDAPDIWKSCLCETQGEIKEKE